MMPEAKFLVMVEYEKVSGSMHQALEDAGIFYCYIDDFCTGNSDEVRMKALLSQMQARIDEQVHFNVRQMLKEVNRATRAEMGTREERQFFDKYIRQMRVSIDQEGNLRLRLGQ